MSQSVAVLFGVLVANRCLPPLSSGELEGLHLESMGRMWGVVTKGGHTSQAPGLEIGNCYWKLESLCHFLIYITSLK